jgi:uncharacterized membrane protein
MQTPHTLDGMLYMKNSVYHDQGGTISLVWDYDAINWINKNIKGQPVILEATTQIYRWGSRVSVYTGLPTVIGWDWHETAHRFSDIEVKRRVEDVKRIYETTDMKEFMSIIKKYDVQYIYIGKLEELYYPGEGLMKFRDNEKNGLIRVYENPEVILLKVR